MKKYLLVLLLISTAFVTPALCQEEEASSDKELVAQTALTVIVSTLVSASGPYAIP